MQKIALIFSLFILIATSLYAKHYADRGLSGKIALTSRDETFNTNSTKNTQKNFMQEYGLRYKGNIYNPKLIDYDLSALFRFDDIKYTGINSSSTNLNSTDYNLNVNFLNSSDIPFTLYVRQSDRPTYTIYYDSNLKLQEDNNRKGLRGLVKLSKSLNINYEVYNENYVRLNESKTLDTNNTLKLKYQLQDNNIKTYKTAVRYNTRKNNVQLRVQRDQREISTLSTITTDTTNHVDADSVVKSQDDTIRFNSRSSITPDFILSSFANYVQRDISDSKTLSTNINLDWLPQKAKYNGNLNVNFNKAEFSIIDEANLSNPSKKNFQTDVIQFRQQFNYNITQDLVLREAINLISYGSDLTKGDSNGLHFSANYNTKINAYRSVRASVNVDTKKNNDQYTATDANTSLQSVRNVNEILYTYDATTAVVEVFPSIFSKLDLSFRYSNRDSSLGIKTSNYTTGCSLNSNYWKFSNSLSTSYTASDNANKTNNTNTTAIFFSDKLNFASQLWRKGRIFTSIGFRYDNSNSNVFNLEHKYINSKVDFNYRLFSKVDFNINANAEKETVLNQIFIQGTSNLRYTAGQTEMVLSYRYNKTTSTVANFPLATSRSVVEATLVRRF